MRWFRALLGVGALILHAGPLGGQESDWESPSEASAPSRLQLRTIEADLSPSVDITLPSGNVFVESTTSFAKLGLSVAMEYNFIDNSIGARVGFFYPLGLLLPELIFFDAVDFESTVRPSITSDDVSLIPSERYVSRQRGGEARLFVRPTPEWRIGPSFIVAEVFQGSLTEGEIIDDAIYYTVRLSTAVDTLTAADLVDDVFAGAELSSSLDWRFRNWFDAPTDLDHISSLALHSGFRSDMALEPRITVAYPIQVWDGDKARFYSLGGVGTVRGFEPDSINAYRYALGSLDIRPAVFRRFFIPLRARNAHGRIHRFRLLFLSDVVATQKSTDIRSKIQWNASAGAGISMVLSGEGGSHFRTRLYLAWPLEKDTSPVFYWQTSFFRLERRM